MRVRYMLIAQTRFSSFFCWPIVHVSLLLLLFGCLVCLVCLSCLFCLFVLLFVLFVCLVCLCVYLGGFAWNSFHVPLYLHVISTCLPEWYCNNCRARDIVLPRLESSSYPLGTSFPHPLTELLVLTEADWWVGCI